MFHPGEMNPGYCAAEKQQQLQSSHLNQKKFAVGTGKRQLAQAVIEAEVQKQTETLYRLHWKFADYLPLAVAAVSVVAVVAGGDDDADY